MNLNNRIFFYVQKKAAHSMRLCAAFVAANLLIFFTFRPFVWGGGKFIYHVVIYAFGCIKV